MKYFHAYAICENLYLQSYSPTSYIYILIPLPSYSIYSFDSFSHFVPFCAYISALHRFNYNTEWTFFVESIFRKTCFNFLHFLYTQTYPIDTYT